MCSIIAAPQTFAPFLSGLWLREEHLWETRLGPEGLRAGQLLDHRTCGQSRGTLVPCLALLPGTTPLRPALHTQGAHLHACIHGPTLPQPPVHTPTGRAVVSGPQTCRLEPGHPVLCGCSSRWGWGGCVVPLQKAHAEAPLLAFLYTHTTYTRAHVHVHTDRWKARWPQQAGCSETPSMGTGQSTCL